MGVCIEDPSRRGARFGDSTPGGLKSEIHNSEAGGIQASVRARAKKESSIGYSSRQNVEPTGQLITNKTIPDRIPKYLQPLEA